MTRKNFNINNITPPNNKNFQIDNIRQTNAGKPFVYRTQPTKCPMCNSPLQLYEIERITNSSVTKNWRCKICGWEW
jgi:rubredoxin